MTMLLERSSTNREPERECEVVNGVEVELPEMSVESRMIIGRLSRLLSNHALANNLGEAHPEIKIKLPPPVDNQRIPDVIFVPFSKWAKNRRLPQTDAWEIVPDLCVEVLSPFDKIESLDEKVEEYLDSGVKTVWIVQPSVKQVRVYDSPDAIRVLRKHQTLTGGALLPGFELPLSELFPSE